MRNTSLAFPRVSSFIHRRDAYYEYPGTLGISHGTTHDLLVCGLRLLILYV